MEGDIFDTLKNEFNIEEEKAKLRAEGRKPAIRFNIEKAQKAFHEKFSFSEII